jgi:hypothetical protein
MGIAPCGGWSSIGRSELAQSNDDPVLRRRAAIARPSRREGVRVHGNRDVLAQTWLAFAESAGAPYPWRRRHQGPPQQLEIAGSPGAQAKSSSRRRTYAHVAMVTHLDADLLVQAARAKARLRPAVDSNMRTTTEGRASAPLTRRTPYARAAETLDPPAWKRDIPAGLDTNQILGSRHR